MVRLQFGKDDLMSKTYLTPLTSINPASLTVFTFHLTAQNAHHFLYRYWMLALVVNVLFR